MIRDRLTPVPDPANIRWPEDSTVSKSKAGKSRRAGK